MYYCNIINSSADIHLRFTEIYTLSLGRLKIEVSCIFLSSLAPIFLIFLPAPLFVSGFTSSQIVSLFSIHRESLSPLLLSTMAVPHSASASRTHFDGPAASKAEQLLINLVVAPPANDQVLQSYRELILT